MSIAFVKIAVKHTLAWATMICLGIAIWLLLPNRFDHLLKEDLTALTPSTLKSLQDNNNRLLDKIIKTSVDYKNQVNEMYARRACQISTYSDSLMNIPTNLNILADFNNILIEAVDREPVIIKEMNRLNSMSFPNHDIYLGDIGLDFIHLQIRLMESLALQYFEAKTGGVSTSGWGFGNTMLSFTDLGAQKSDTIRADIIMHTYDDTGFDEMNANLNGHPLRMEQGEFIFERRFEKPGIYPLKASISARKMRSDSLCTWEKTFYLKVQE